MSPGVKWRQKNGNNNKKKKKQQQQCAIKFNFN